MKIYFIVSIDTECDKGPKWKVRQPIQFKNILVGIPKILQPLFEKYNIRPTYLLSPEVLRNDVCVDLFKSLAHQADIGAHMHAEFIEPYENWATDNTFIFQSDLDPEIEFEKIKNLTSLFREKIGYFPLSFRAGRFGISRYTLSYLQKLGYLVDSSVTPYMWWWKSKGKAINFLGAPNQPYHPSFSDFRRKGKAEILEVPITLINPFWDRCPQMLLKSINPAKKVQTVFLNIFLKKYLKPRWLRPTFSTAKDMLYVTEYLYSKPSGNSIVLCMMFHSNEIVKGMSPYNSSENEVKDFLFRLEGYFDKLFSKYDVVSIGLSDIARQYPFISAKKRKEFGESE